MDHAAGMDTAVSTGTEATATVIPRVNVGPPETENHSDTNGTSNRASNGTKEIKKAIVHNKYRHTAAVHSKSRPSTLSHDATETPSFLGFRNLGLIVLGELKPLVLPVHRRYCAGLPRVTSANK